MIQHQYQDKCPWCNPSIVDQAHERALVIAIDSAHEEALKIEKTRAEFEMHRKMQELGLSALRQQMLSNPTAVSLVPRYYQSSYFGTGTVVSWASAQTNPWKTSW